MSSKEAFISGPLVFGEADRQLFGWYHAPARPARRGGVVLCNPFGYESMCLHRVYRLLAERIAAVGIPAFRFDYHGTGDSAGSDHDEDRVAAWVGSVGDAIDELRERAAIEEVSLVGVRFGATVAVLAGLERTAGGSRIDDVIASMVLWSPYLTGRAFLKEMRMMQTAGAEQAFAPASERGTSPSMAAMPASSRTPALGVDEEAIGYLLTAETVHGLGAIDLRAKKVAPTKRIMLLGRDDLPEDDRFARHLADSGVDVRKTNVPGYAAMMQDAYLSKVPDEAFDRIIEWLTDVHGKRPDFVDEELGDRPTLTDFSRAGPHLITDSIAEIAHPSAVPSSVRSASIRPARTTRVREEALMFGARGQLLGILTEPSDRGLQRSESDAVIFLNIGSNHRVGSNRMYVKMARTLASRGTISLRFDIGGIGDSAASDGNENRLYAKEAVHDVQAAMTELTSRRNVQRFHLVGLCSGAYLAFKTAFADPRVAGQILINTQTFMWKEGDTLTVSLRKNYRSTRFYTTEMWNPTTWKRVIRGEVNAKGIAGTLGRRAFDRAVREAEATIARVRHGRLEIDEVAVEFKEILKRGAQTLLVFGANDGGLDKMEMHLGPDAKKVMKYPNFRLEIVDGSDHTFTPLWSQSWLEAVVIATIEEWRTPTTTT